MPTMTARRIAAGFLAQQFRTSRNTYTDGHAIYLHHNKIVWRDDEGNILACMRGWPTVTTRDRINAVADQLNVPGVFQKNFDQFIGDHEIDPYEEFVVKSAPRNAKA